jgi:hypothetical protein
VEAQLSSDPDLKVQRKSGGLGELRVEVDGTDVVDTNLLLYPTPTSVAKKVRDYLAASKS